jgi:hypothetical protein
VILVRSPHAHVVKIAAVAGDEAAVFFPLRRGADQHEGGDPGA